MFKSNFARKYIFFVTICSMLLVSSLIVFGQSQPEVSGSLKVTFKWEKQDVEKAKSWYDFSIMKGKEAAEKELHKTTDYKVREDLVSVSEAFENQKSNRAFKDQKDGSSTLEIPLPNVDIQFGDLKTKTDSKGNFIINGLETKTYPVVISYEGKEVYRTQLKVNKNQILDINLSFPGNNIFKAADLMSEYMLSEENIQTASTNFPIYSIGTIVPGSSGKGTMKIVAANNIVGCNKADKTIGDSANFPLNFSDCSVSIGLGTAYASNSITFMWAYMSYNCFLESLQNFGDGNEQNVYCNGKNKSGHYNCSWFNGIGCTESLHTH